MPAAEAAGRAFLAEKTDDQATLFSRAARAALQGVGASYTLALDNLSKELGERERWLREIR